MKVRDVMVTDLITVDADEPVTTAVDLMEKHGISRLLVRDEGKIVGIITERDVVKAVGSRKKRGKKPTHIYVSSACTKDLVWVRPDDDIRKVVKLMLDKKISSVVVKDNDKVVGIVTKTDVVRTLKDNEEPVTSYMNKPIVLKQDDSLIEARKKMLDYGIKKFPVVNDGMIVGILTESDMAKILVGFKKLIDDENIEREMERLRVRDVMSRKITTIDKDATVGEAVKVMLEKGISSLPIVDNGRLVGIVTKTDFLKFYL